MENKTLGPKHRPKIGTRPYYFWDTFKTPHNRIEVTIEFEKSSVNIIISNEARLGIATM